MTHALNLRGAKLLIFQKDAGYGYLKTSRKLVGSLIDRKDRHKDSFLIHLEVKQRQNS